VAAVLIRREAKQQLKHNAQARTLAWLDSHREKSGNYPIKNNAQTRIAVWQESHHFTLTFVPRAVEFDYIPSFPVNTEHAAST
jgi:hypothetical protein